MKQPIFKNKKTKVYVTLYTIIIVSGSYGLFLILEWML